MKRFMCALLLCIMIASLVPTALAETYYVYTENGKGLNIRQYPSTLAPVLGTVRFGGSVEVIALDAGNGWTLIHYSGESNLGNWYGDAYVQTKFLTPYYPGTAPAKPSTSVITKAVDQFMAIMNREFRSARYNSFYVYSAPVRKSGWVNLRWAPSEQAEVILKCYSDRKLKVLAELINWYQVQDVSTGRVGFIMKQYTRRNK